MNKAYAILIIVVLVSVLSVIAGCGGSTSKATTTSVASPSSNTATETNSPEYSEKSVPLEDVDVNDLESIEITPSGDPNCFLSPCDCNCYLVKNVPLDKKKPTCAVNCRQQYGISGCVFREYRCSAIQS